MTTIKIGQISLDAAAFYAQGGAVLGIRGSGKTYTATLLAERAHDAGVPFTAFDPVGVWRFLRVPGPGRSGRGYPVVVAGGEDGDLALTPASAPAIVEAAMQNGVSLVIDLFSMELSKADWRRIVRDSIKLMLHRNKEHGLRHIFIEEAAEFVPQRVVDGDVYAMVEKLARMGGNSRLGYTLINQRSEEVNKAVLELCDNLFLHRQKGRNSLLNLSRWLDVGNAAGGKEIINSLATLPAGECWAWLAGSDRPVHLKVPAKHSLHPDRNVMRGDADVVASKAVDVAGFVDKMKATLPAIEADAKANDPRALRAEITTLKRQMADAAAKAAQAGQTPDPLVMATRYQEGREAGAKEKIYGLMKRISALHDEAARIAESVLALSNSLKQISNDADGPYTGPYSNADVAQLVEHRASNAKVAGSSPAVRSNPTMAVSQAVSRKEPPRSSGSPAVDLPKGEKATLIALAQYPNGLAREQLTVLTGYKRSSRDSYLQRLGERGYVSRDGAKMTITDSGIAALGSDYQPLPTGAALRDYWLDRLPEGEGVILMVLIRHYPNWIGRGDLDHATRYKRSSRDSYLQRLRAKELVTAEGGAVRAADVLFQGS